MGVEPISSRGDYARPSSSELQRQTAELANQLSERLINLRTFIERMYALQWVNISALTHQVLEKNCYFYNCQTMANFALSLVPVYLSDWDREQDFSTWVAGRLMIGLESMDRGLGLSSRELQKQLTHEVEVDEETARFEIALNSLEFEQRRVAYLVLQKGLSLEAIAKQYKLTKPDALALFQEAMGRAKHWAKIAQGGLWQS